MLRFISGLLVLAILLPLTADAQPGRRDRERDRAWEHERCREPIEAAGDAYVWTRFARRSAIKRWRELVINVHGERYMSYENARGPEGGPPLLRCDLASVGILNMKRCVVIARPCKDSNEPDPPPH